MKVFAILLLSCLLTFVSAVYPYPRSDGSAACEAFNRLLDAWGAGDFAAVAKQFAPTADISYAKNLAPGTPYLRDFGSQRVTDPKKLEKLFSEIYNAFDVFEMHFDCFGNIFGKGMTNFHAALLYERLGDDGLVNLKHTHIIQTTDGLISSLQVRLLEKVPQLNAVNSYHTTHADAECDIASEKILAVSGRKPGGGKYTLDECKKWCADKGQACKSLTYFEQSGYCSIFSSLCFNTKPKRNAVVLLKIPHPPSFPGMKPGPKKFVSAGSNVACTGKGEVFIPGSPGKGSSLDACTKACADHLFCESFTFYKSGYCSLFATQCEQTVFNGKAVSMKAVHEKKDEDKDDGKKDDGKKDDGKKDDGKKDDGKKEDDKKSRRLLRSD